MPLINFFIMILNDRDAEGWFTGRSGGEEQNWCLWELSLGSASNLTHGYELVSPDSFVLHCW